MDNATSNRYTMVNVTLGYCADNSDKTAGLPGFAAVKAAADAKVTEIQQNIMIAQGRTEGVTQDTNKKRLSMCEKAGKCASALRAYANVIGDHTLADKVKYSLSGMMRIDKDEVAEICQTIHDEANTHIADAVNYGITADDVTELQTAIDLYEANAQNPRDTRIAIKQANANIKLLVKEVIQIFKEQIDPMINTLRGTERNFAEMYFMCREIINLGITHTKVRGTVKDNEGAPLSGVLLTVTDATTGGTVGTTRTEREGKYSLRLAPGNYDLTWSLNNYQTISELNVRLGLGKEVTRKVVMEGVG